MKKIKINEIIKEVIEKFESTWNLKAIKKYVENANMVYVVFKNLDPNNCIITDYKKFWVRFRIEVFTGKCKCSEIIEYNK